MKIIHVITIFLLLLAETTNDTIVFDLSGITIVMDFVKTLFLVLLPWIFVMLILRAFFSLFGGGRR